MENQLEIYFNTTHETGSDLEQSKMKAGTQNEKILALFIRFRSLSPARAHYYYCQQHETIPLTSIRRGINSLTKLGYLSKTDKKEIGNYGKANYVWTLESKKI